MNYGTKITKIEEKQIMDIIQKDYIKKFDSSSFEKNYKTYQEMPEFMAGGSIHDEDGNILEEYKGFNKGVHYIMRLTAQYHINQAMKALKYDTVNDPNLATDGANNIGSPGRVAKVWGGDKLDNSVFSEFGDGRFVPAPRLAVFPVDRIDIQVKKIKNLENGEQEILTEKDELFLVKRGLKGGNKSFIFTEVETGDIYYIEGDTRIEEGMKLGLIEEQEIVAKTINQKGLSSICSHHFLPFFVGDGKSGIVVAYKPYNKILGISKLTRIVSRVMNRPSLQENTTTQIYKAISKACGSQDVFVMCSALVHTCELTRGSAKDTTTSTEKAGGVFKRDEQLRTSMANTLR